MIIVGLFLRAPFDHLFSYGLLGAGAVLIAVGAISEF